MLDVVRVKWKSVPVKVYEFVSAKETDDNDMVKLVKTFEDGLDQYYQQDWDKALALFNKAEDMEDHFTSRNTTPSSIYID